MNDSTYPENILASLDSLLALRFSAASTFHKSYKKSSALTAGSYTSPFRGRGIDFSEVRLYQPGDDVRTIDWRVTARTGKPHTKMYVEERERPVLFAVDCSASMQFATQGAFKSVIAAKAMALLAWSATRHGDRVGGIVFAGSEHTEIKPSGGKRGILKYLQQLVACNTRQLNRQEPDKEVDLKDILFRLKQVARSGSLIYLISDFSSLNQQDFPLLSQLASRCDLALINVYDVLEKNAPPAGQYRVTNGREVGDIYVDNREFPKLLQQQFENRLHLLELLKRQFGIYSFSIATNENVQQIIRNKLTHKILKSL